MNLLGSFGGDFFEAVLGTARDNLGAFVSQLPAFPSAPRPEPIPAPTFEAPAFDVPTFREAPANNPFFGLGLFSQPAGYVGGGPSGPDASFADYGPFLDTLQFGVNSAVLGAQSERRAAVPPPAPRAGPSSAGPASPGAAPSGLRASTRDTRIAQQIVREATRLGLDPEFALWVAENEGGLDDGAANRRNRRGSHAYGPYQLLIGGGLGDEALRRGIDPRDPNTWAQQITFALEHAARNGWGAWEAVTARGIDPWTGTPRRPAPQAAPASAPPAAGQPAASPSVAPTPAAPARPTAWEQVYAPGTLTPDQYQIARSEGLDDATANAVCGPAAAIAFARANGRNPTMTEALALARQVGWTKEYGMAGTQSQSALLTRMGIPNRLVYGAPDWAAVAREVQAGRPVIIDAGDHYMVAEAYDPRTGAFNFGNSAAVLRRSGGQKWFRPDQLPALSGPGLRISPEAAIYMGGS